MEAGLKHQILNKIDEYHVKSGGLCGISAVEICQVLKVEYVDVREIFNQLFQEKKFKVREGKNGYLLFKAI